MVGGGIVGLAHALALAKTGRRVVLFERTAPAVGASVRNFGLVWPVGQPEGPRHARAMRSREIWLEIAAATGIYLSDRGSLHLAYHDDEWAVLEEFAGTSNGSVHGRRLLTAAQVIEASPSVVASGLLGALWSPTECTVDPRETIREIPGYLSRVYGVQVVPATTVLGINLPCVRTTAGTWTVDTAVVCSGQDFESLYPQAFAASGITRCKLQMLRTEPQPKGWDLGPALCAGLTLAHYDAFKSCLTLPKLKERFAVDHAFCVEHGIHVLLSQTAKGELTIGDSHSYGSTVDPFDRSDIDQAILDYLGSFFRAPAARIREHWHGVYPKMPTGASELVISPEPGVRIVNGLGGAGMTLSFGLAEEVVASL